jgi:anaerobic selenocysteine-containing dehydrogenase
MMHVIINEGLYDADYVSRHTLGFDQLKARVQEYPLEKVAHWTGISAADIRKLAIEYATQRPAVIRVNYGVQRSEGGGMAMRAVAMLPCLVGSWKEVGGGLQLSTSGAFGLNKASLEMPELMQKALGRPARVVNMVKLGWALNSLDVPPILALFVYNSNPAAVCPNHNEVIRGLKRPDLFTVVHEQFFTDTTDYADIVLPATTFFEHKDLQGAYGHYYLQVSSQAIEPLGECRSNVDLFGALAQRMGFEDEFFRESVDSMIDRALNSPNPWLKGITRDRLERENQIRLNFANDHGATAAPGRPAEPEDSATSTAFLSFANGKFHTPSRKAEFYSETLKAQGLDPVVAFTPPAESRHGAQAKSFPLELLARKPDNHLNSTFANISSVRKLEPSMAMIEMHASDAEPRGIRDGDRVRAFNLRGEIVLQAKVNGSVPPGVVAARLDWARFGPGGRNINVLTSEKLTDMGNAATFYSVCVEVELFRA